MVFAELHVWKDSVLLDEESAAPARGFAVVSALAPGRVEVPALAGVDIEGVAIEEGEVGLAFAICKLGFVYAVCATGVALANGDEIAVDVGGVFTRAATGNVVVGYAKSQTTGAANEAFKLELWAGGVRIAT